MGEKVEARWRDKYEEWIKTNYVGKGKRWKLEEKQGQENEKEMTYSLFLGFDSRKIINECDGRIGADA